MAGGERTHYQETFAVLALGVAAFALLQSLVIPVLTTVQHELHTTQSAVTWVLTAYLLSASIMTPILGRVGDMMGKKRVFVATLVALAVGSLLAALATSIGVMILARVIQGFAGGMLPVAFGIIRDEFPAARIAGAVGLIASLTAVGAGLGIVLAGPIVSVLDYQWLFWLPLILTVVAAASAVLLVPESPVRTPGRISFPPAILLSGWLVALLVALGLLLGVGMYATFAFLPEFVQTPAVAGYGFGASITRSGLMLLPSAITMFAVGMFAGRLARRLGGKTLVAAGCLIGCAAMMILAFAHHHAWQIYSSNALMGIGFGLAFSAMSALVVAAVPASQTGVASGMNANIRTIGGSIGSAVMASIVTSQLAPSGLPAANPIRQPPATVADGAGERRGSRRLSGQPERL